MKQRNLELARESGCVSLFCGVESFDSDSLASFDKRQNMTNQVDLIVSVGNSATQLLPKYRNRKRTFVSTSECLDPVYEPLCLVSSKFQRYFEPVYVTDESGMLNPEFEELLAKPAKQATA